VKSRTLTCITAMSLFATLAVLVRLAAQDGTAQASKPKHHHYQLIDLGTFGGPTSGLNFGTEVVNNRGTVGGQADTSIPNHPNSCIFCGDPFIFHAFQWQNGILNDLGSLRGLNSSGANWISNRGLSAGFSETTAIDPLLGIREAHAVVWKNGQITDLGTLEGGYESVAFSVNSRGQVAGVSTNLVPDPFGPLGTQNRTFLWQDGVMRDLGTLGGPDAGLLGMDGNVEMNERGQVVACSYTNSTPNPVTGTPTLAPFLWDGKMLDLGSLGGTSGCAIFLNNQGQVVGYSNLAGDQTFHPFLWERGQLTDLGTLGGPTGIAFWINEAGEVVGNADLDSPPGCTYPNCAFHGFLWKNGVTTDIGTVNGLAESNAAAINSKTQIVGASFASDFSVFDAILWEKGSLGDLNTLVSPGSALHLAIGVDINERGEIAGLGCLRDGDCHAVVLLPCDENHPDIEGCDYSMVDVSTQVPVQTVAPNVSRPMLPFSLWHRNNRFHFSALGPRN
jgi:probable HAF family extracellular repeat protein